ncbi:MAG: hypothetical protein HYY59_03135 [Candidatus Omnitrophica bacterium]|nr:hypothetical protein [Candidatus Omnitrophota bacterium]
MKPRKPKRPRSLRLSLHPLSLEEALKKALAIPFVSSKKQEKSRQK